MSLSNSTLYVFQMYNILRMHHYGGLLHYSQQASKLKPVYRNVRKKRGLLIILSGLPH